MTDLPQNKMPEAEVSLRLAFGLFERDLVVSTVEVAIDGAQIRTGTTVHFPIESFMRDMGWSLVKQDKEWRGMYRHKDYSYDLLVHSSPGRGDVVADLKNGRTLRAESKKGSLVRSKSSQEYTLVREALGQLLTVKEASSSDVLAVAVPSSEKFESLAAQWRPRPLMIRAGVHIATVNRLNQIKGLEDVGI
ncbi:MAG: hypothetical protein AseanaTS_15500 [Candidatus Pelagadaptatus aseana]|uniref:hypothetical protein n=1 Tax=Candidatus Pelagadaptatus aseana TaxID=3120508 RepID=UPI0039B2B156